MIFLTGATGFVGSALLKRLVDDGVDVFALVREGSHSLPAGVKSLTWDLSALAEIGGLPPHFVSYNDRKQNQNDGKDFNGLDSLAMTLKNSDVVVHAAARAHIMNDESIDPLAEYRKVNRDATLTLASLAAESGVKRFVFISSIKVNGEMTSAGMPFEAEISEPPVDPYGLSKYEAEQGLLEIANETGMEVVIIRPPLVYGPGAPGNFASLVNWVKRGIPLPLGSVQNQRSLVALDNLVDFIALCADRERSPKAANEVFLISDGREVSTSELLRSVAKAYGVKSRLLPIPVGLMKFAAKLLGKGAVADRLFANLQVDSLKAHELLGWKLVITMDQQLAKMAEYDKKSFK
ncbi:UDP-glucose 4-epimerase family protein [Thiomicrorhabdus xiamenensis]|uniref:SDR family oxidoreductase n=1 Tax=Thiomicrorhabdus xiamenensis TaxID=2739063 RepID=A0A7D4TBJ6_9GAMM|nr:SDR family oxidoreductase [Thiomicrorhabdus xiamenensis]QKI89766.1 SDR family oxidoreductase [Thiomicrorhabdus xiamenensis]